MRAEPLVLEFAAAFATLLGGDRSWRLFQTLPLFPKFRSQFALVPSQMTSSPSNGEQLAAQTTGVAPVVGTVLQFHEEVEHSDAVAG